LTTQPPDPISAEEVSAKIQELLELERERGSREFAEALADNIMEPDPVETAAFRSDELAFLSYTGARYLIDHSNEVLRDRRRGSRQAHDTRRFQMEVGRERRILESIVNGIRAKKGMLPNQPNIRRRAERRLVQENLKGPVPQGRFIELLREEEEREQQRKRDAKRARAQARKAQRATEN
jgi:hypothetical protein